VEFANSNFDTAKQIIGVLKLQAILVKKRKRETMAKEGSHTSHGSGRLRTRVHV
jgi:hypothetical protein